MEDFVGKDQEFVPDWLLLRVLDNIGDLFKGMFRRFYDFFYLFFRGGVFALFFPPHPRESATQKENSYNVRGLAAGGMGAAGIEGMHKLESFLPARGTLHRIIRIFGCFSLVTQFSHFHFIPEINYHVYTRISSSIKIKVTQKINCGGRPVYDSGVQQYIPGASILLRIGENCAQGLESCPRPQAGSHTR